MRRPPSFGALWLGIALPLGALSAGCSDDPVPVPVKHLIALNAGLDFVQGTAPEAIEVDLVVSVARQIGGCAEPCAASIATDVAVQVAAAEGPITLDYNPASGDYQGTSLGYSPRYAVTVDIDGERIEHEARSPSLFSFHFDPEPPIAGAEAAIVWAPSSEPGVTAVSLVSAPQGATYITPAANDYPDDGREDLPASALPIAGSYEVTLQRRLAEEEPTFFGSVTILARSAVTALPPSAP